MNLPYETETSIWQRNEEFNGFTFCRRFEVLVEDINGSRDLATSFTPLKGHRRVAILEQIICAKSVSAGHMED